MCISIYSLILLSSELCIYLLRHILIFNFSQNFCEQFWCSIKVWHVTYCTKQSTSSEPNTPGESWNYPPFWNSKSRYSLGTTCPSGVNKFNVNNPDIYIVLHVSTLHYSVYSPIDTVQIQLNPVITFKTYFFDTILILSSTKKIRFSE
jgi:hypothetical protein